MTKPKSTYVDFLVRQIQSGKKTLKEIKDSVSSEDTIAAIEAALKSSKDPGFHAKNSTHTEPPKPESRQPEEWVDTENSCDGDSENTEWVKVIEIAEMSGLKGGTAKGRLREKHIWGKYIKYEKSSGRYGRKMLVNTAILNDPNWTKPRRTRTAMERHEPVLLARKEINPPIKKPFSVETTITTNEEKPPQKTAKEKKKIVPENELSEDYASTTEKRGLEVDVKVDAPEAEDVLSTKVTVDPEDEPTPKVERAVHKFGTHVTECSGDGCKGCYCHCHSPDVDWDEIPGCYDELPPHAGIPATSVINIPKKTVREKLRSIFKRGKTPLEMIEDKITELKNKRDEINFEILTLKNAILILKK